MGAIIEVKDLPDLCENAVSADPGEIVRAGISVLSEFIKRPSDGEIGRAIDALIECGAHREAVLLIMPFEWGYMTGRSAGGGYKAFVTAGFGSIETDCDAHHEALALIGAMAKVVVPGEDTLMH